MSQYLTDGHPTTVSFALNPSIKLKETSVSPPGLDGRGPNNTTTMRNSTWTTQQPKKLKTMTDFSFIAQYNPDVYTAILAMMNTIQAITVTFSDSSSITFQGWINSFQPQDHVEGAMPTATVSVCVSNQTAAGVETAPTIST